MNQEIEKLEDDKEIELTNGNVGIVAHSKDDVEEILYLADNIEKIVQAQNKIRNVLLKLAQSGDWVVFGEGDKAKAELGFAGAMRVGATIGVNFTDWTAEKETGTDDKGQWYRWNYECTASYRNRSVRVFGRGSSRDKFFGKQAGEYKQLHDIDEGNIKMAARRGAMKEGVKVLFGLHHLNPKELESYGVTLDYANKYAFKNKDEQAANTQEVQVIMATVEKITKKVDPNGKWTKYTITDTEGSFYSTFDKKIAEFADTVRVSKEVVRLSYIVGKFGNEIKGIEPANGGA